MKDRSAPATVVACWLPTQDKAGSNYPHFTQIFHKFCTFSTFIRNPVGKNPNIMCPAINLSGLT